MPFRPQPGNLPSPRALFRCTARSFSIAAVALPRSGHCPIDYSRSGFRSRFLRTPPTSNQALVNRGYAFKTVEHMSSLIRRLGQFDDRDLISIFRVFRKLPQAFDGFGLNEGAAVRTVYRFLSDAPLQF